MRARARLLAALVCGLLPTVAAAATFTVDTTDDAVDAVPMDGVCATASGACSLRAAIMEANALPGADTIIVPAGTYVLALAGRDEDDAATGDLDVNDDVTIQGAGSAATILDGNGLDRLFDVLAETTISGVTLRNGNPGTGSTGHHGGAIFNGDVLTLTDAVITGNAAESAGGGIANTGTLTITDVTLSGNTAGTTGGGLDSAGGVALTNVTVSGNSATRGGGLASDGDQLDLTNVTVSGNTATTAGGGLENAFVASLTNVTVVGNAAPVAGGVDGVGTTMLRNTIVAGNEGGDCGGPMQPTSGGHNLEGKSTCGLAGPGDLTETDPRVGPLADNGGPTATHALLPDSPAIDAGADCPPPAVDQRGVERPIDGNGDGVAACDIGAYEAPAAACRVAPTFPSVACRLDALLGTVRAQGKVGRIRDRIERGLADAKMRLATGEMALRDGQARLARKMARKALGRVAAVARLVRSRRVRALFPSDVLAGFRDETDGVRRDLSILRRLLTA